MKYRVRTVEVEAICFEPAGAHRTELPEGVEGMRPPNQEHWEGGECAFYMITKDGRKGLYPGDFIVMYGNGTLDIVDAAEFESTYEESS